MKTVLLTGATSFIGFALCNQMIKMGLDVHVVTRPSTDISRFNTCSASPTIHVDQGTADCLGKAVTISQPDVVYHMATKYVREHSPDDVATMVQSNIGFGARLLDAMSLAGARHFIYAGTYAQHYGGNEAESLNLNAATKEAFRTLVAYYVDAKGIFASQLTLFDVYGPGDWRFRLVDAILKSLSSGDALPLPSEDLPLDLIYVDDAVSAFVQAGQKLCQTPETISGREFAVSSGQHLLLSEIIDVFEQVAGKKVSRDWGQFPIPERAPRSLWRGDPVPDWQPEIPLAEGVRRLINETGVN
jgi:nucleoside-diphosphate-sugar epimerase